MPGAITIIGITMRGIPTRIIGTAAIMLGTVHITGNLTIITDGMSHIITDLGPYWVRSEPSAQLRPA